MPHEPHFIRFTRALAIAAALAACGGSTSDPSESREPSTEDPSRRDGTEVADASSKTDASRARDASPEPADATPPPYDASGASGPLCPPELPATWV